jgi:hypothetical protein
MTTHIFNQHNQCISEGKNLAIIFSYARKMGGVEKIQVYRLHDSKHYECMVNVYFKHGFRAVTNFVSFDHAIEWANEKSKRKNTYWTDCKVEVTN